MRKLNRVAANAAVPPVQAAPAPAPAPEPAATTAVATVPRAQIAKPVAGIPSFVKPANMETSAKGTAPWVGFYEQRMEGGRAQAIVQQLGPQATGAPFLCVSGDGGERFYSMAGLAVVALDAYFYWCTLTPGVWTPDKVWTENPGRGDGIKEQAKAILLVVPGTQELPEPLRHLGAVTTLTNFRGPKCPALKELVEAIEATQSPEWARANGALVNVPPQFRVCATIVSSGPISSSSGYSYVKASAQVRPCGAAQLTALEKWKQTAGGALEDVSAFYERSIDELEKLAAKPK